MQNLSPLDIQKQLFNRRLRGFDVDEVRAYLHVVAEEMENLVRENQILSRDVASMREELREHANRERILKDTLLSAQNVAEEMRETARREAELIVREAEGAAERTMAHALERVGEIERAVQDLRIERKALRNRLGALVDTFQQMLEMDQEEDSRSEPLATIHRRRSESA